MKKLISPYLITIMAVFGVLCVESFRIEKPIDSFIVTVFYSTIALPSLISIIALIKYLFYLEFDAKYHIMFNSLVEVMMRMLE
jgi:hypothetical protein